MYPSPSRFSSVTTCLLGTQWFAAVLASRSEAEAGSTHGTANASVTSSFLLRVVRPGAPSSVLAASSDALFYLLLVVRRGAPIVAALLRS